MNSYLFARSIGTVSSQTLQRFHSTGLLHALHPAPGIRFDGRDGQSHDEKGAVYAHKAGVNCIAIDKFEGR